ncbi:hypothetical protein NPIL_283931 [Nephila pilipes]|uniref:Uncharacterized protein n=1 Tax=Nephila pilipes TaxID=299642 RepID=A0A8X6IS88_NEPPI|nr:hypothetical protein NPIL_283931 [Nephila pilipes]
MIRRAEMIVSKNKYQVPEDSLESEDQSNQSTSHVNSIGKQSDSASNSTDDYEWRRNIDEKYRQRAVAYKVSECPAEKNGNSGLEEHAEYCASRRKEPEKCSFARVILVMSRINRENKRQRLSSSPQTGPSGYQAPAAEEIKQEVVLV